MGTPMVDQGSRVLECTQVRVREDEKEEGVPSSPLDQSSTPWSFLDAVVPIFASASNTHVHGASSPEKLCGPEHKHFLVGGLALLCEGFLPLQHGLPDQSPQTQMVSVNENQRDMEERLA